MYEESEAISRCLAHKAHLETSLARTHGQDRKRLLAEISAGERLIERLRREASARLPAPTVMSPQTRAQEQRHLRLVASS